MLRSNSAPYHEAYSLIKEKIVLEKFIGCSEIVQYFGEALAVETDNNSIYNLVLEYAGGENLA